MKKDRPVWEYQTVFIHYQGLDLMVETLNTQGKDGWELVQLILLTHGSYNALMKRLVYK